MGLRWWSEECKDVSLDDFIDCFCCCYLVGHSAYVIPLVGDDWRACLQACIINRSSRAKSVLSINFSFPPSVRPSLPGSPSPTLLIAKRLRACCHECKGAYL